MTGYTSPHLPVYGVQPRLRVGLPAVQTLAPLEGGVVPELGTTVTHVTALRAAPDPAPVPEAAVPVATTGTSGRWSSAVVDGVPPMACWICEGSLRRL